MKGTLQKNEYNLWVVRYRETTPLSITTETLRLHPEFIEMMDTCFTSKFSQEVEFEIVTEWENGEVGVNGLTYAKLTHHPVDTNKMIDHIGEVNEMVNHVPDVGKMVSNSEIGKRRWDDWDEFNKKACYPEDYQSAFADGFTRGAKWVNEIVKETLYTEEQVREAMNCTVLSAKAKERVIQSLKQPKQ
jgi:hypothetical protein